MLAFIQSPRCQTETYKIRTISFYNVENLFDTIHDENKFDDDFLPKGKNKYTSAVYWTKIENIAKVISQIGFDKTHESPAIIGLAEIENRNVLEDLINSKSLKNNSYQYLHFDSPDIRGIDVALLYQEAYFAPLNHQVFEVRLWDEEGKRIHTRDQLLVSGLLDNDLIHIIINHWPSRRGGKKRSEAKRLKASYISQQIIDHIKKEDVNAKIIVMGDFNDDPKDESIKKGLNSVGSTSNMTIDRLFNPMEAMFNSGLNTLGYRDGINLFDQILISYDFLSQDNSYKSYKFYTAGIFNPAYLTIENGMYKGYPKRSFQKNVFSGGFSDHYPVYIYLIKKEEFN